ncbi:MAG TPA: M23 family metallopeptidase [Candidatus Acidoferrales bacterium]|nr:M23 family metallopeptidase [Candidatus Acidoferrales bacterium]
MRIRLFASFAFGFAAGMACLTALLWTAGALHHPIAAAQQPVLAAPPAAAAALVQPLPPANTVVPAPPTTLPGAPKLAMPIADIDPAKLTDTFAQTRDGHPHEALDIPAPRGTPVLAADEGNVVKLFTSKQGGLTVYQFNDAGDLCYYYAHLDHYAPSLKEGTLLRRGDVLGYVGSTGDASPDAPHLHFAVFRLGPEREWWKGTAIDPLPLLRGSGTH